MLFVRTRSYVVGQWNDIWDSRNSLSILLDSRSNVNRALLMVLRSPRVGTSINFLRLFNDGRGVNFNIPTTNLTNLFWTRSIISEFVTWWETRLQTHIQASNVRKCNWYLVVRIIDIERPFINANIQFQSFEWKKPIKKR